MTPPESPSGANGAGPLPSSRYEKRKPSRLPAHLKLAVADNADVSKVTFQTPLHPKCAALARRYIALRRRRGEILGSQLFIDPAWDIVLDLFVAYSEQRSISVTSACLASGVPTSTALRWLCELEQAGLIRRMPDVSDRRRTFVTLDASAAIKLQHWLQMLFGVS